MVPRPRSPGGKRVPMTTRFSESEAAEIDAARGNTSASEWLREAALAAARASGRKSLPTDAIMITVDDRMPPGTAAFVGRGKVTPVRFREPEPERTPKNCKHPNLRSKGVCPDCYEWVASKPRT